MDKASLSSVTIVGNLLFILWIAYNAIDSGFQGRPLEKASFIGPPFLLVLNTRLRLEPVNYQLVAPD
jgi:hypothetical protein